ncbi:MAG: serine/threonine protein kinase [Paraglaciecola sp.]|nr:serine/threonine protein kinase [Paraglaciecola sp.]NCT47990.1 serine/threonine protein kinase [Paraglaciecola sp.]
MSTFDFSGLSPDLILDAIETVGFRVDSGLLALNSYENRVYQFIEEDKRRYVVKFYRPQRWSVQQIEEEHSFSVELASHDIPVVAPLSFNGRTLLHYQGYHFALFPSVGGRQFEVDNLDQLEWMGRFIGRIHAVSKRCLFNHRPNLSVQEHLIEPMNSLQHSSLVPDYLRPSLAAILQPVVNQASAMFKVAANSMIRLHGDCHPGNILWRDGPTFVDLDDCRNGPAIQDLWMMLSGDRQQQTLQLDVLINAYEEFADFDKSQLRLIEPLRAMRMVHYMAWLAKRWLDPAFPQAFPWFAEGKYWEQQILTLKEQLAALDEAPLQLF